MSRFFQKLGGNRNRHRTPPVKKYRLTKLLCMSKQNWEELERLLNVHKRIYRKGAVGKQQEPASGIYVNDYSDDSLRVDMSNWYHGMFASIKTRLCSEDQLWGELSVEQRINLKKILNGEF